MKTKSKALSTFTSIVITLTLMSQVVPVTAPSPTWHTHEELVTMFKTLCDSHSEYASYESIGKTYEGRDIWIFKIGNPNGGRVMWDGCLHGWEDLGSEVMYLIAEWLLESDDNRATRILARNYVLFIPVVNADSYERENRNFETSKYGVDLNRNFENGWTYTAPNNPYPNTYHGDHAASEPETQAMRYAFEIYHPDFYVNTHMGGEYLNSHRNSNSTLVNIVKQRITELSSEMNVKKYSMGSSGSNGFAIGDAHDFGASAWLFEMVTGEGLYSHTFADLEDIENIYFPRSLPIFIAMCEACETDSPMPPPPPNPPPANPSPTSDWIYASGRISYSPKTLSTADFGWSGCITSKAEVIPLLDKLKADGWNTIRYQSVPDWADHDGRRVPIDYEILDHLVDEAKKRGMIVYLLCAHAWQPSTGEGGSGSFIDGHEQEWIDDYRSIAQRYADDDDIVIDAWSEYSSSQGKSRYQSLAQMFLDDFRSYGLNMRIHFNVWWNSPLFALNDPKNNYSEGRHHYGGFLDDYNPSTLVDYETVCEESGINDAIYRYFEEDNPMFFQEALRLGIPYYVISEMGASETPTEAYGGQYSMSVGNIAYAKKLLEVSKEKGVTCIMHRVGWLSDYDLYYQYSEEYFGESFFTDPG